MWTIASACGRVCHHWPATGERASADWTCNSPLIWHSPCSGLTRACQVHITCAVCPQVTRGQSGLVGPCSVSLEWYIIHPQSFVLLLWTVMLHAHYRAVLLWNNIIAWTLYTAVRVEYHNYRHVYILLCSGFAVDYHFIHACSVVLLWNIISWTLYDGVAVEYCVYMTTRQCAWNIIITYMYTTVQWFCCGLSVHTHSFTGAAVEYRCVYTVPAVLLAVYIS